MIQSLLGYRYKSLWHQVFPIIAAVFAAFPATVQLPSGSVHCLSLLSPLLSALDSLHSTADIAKEYGASIEDAIGAAIAYHGPEQLLSQLPLQLPIATATPSTFTQQLAASRVWLLPLIRQHTRATTAASFFTAIQPHITAVHAQAQQWESEGQPTHRRACELLVEQLWDTFPAFCHWCVDVSSMRQWAKRVGDWLTGNEWQYAHPLLARGLTIMIRDNQQVVHEWEQKATDEQQHDDDATEAAKVFEEDDDEDDVKDGPSKTATAIDGPSKTATAIATTTHKKDTSTAAVVVKYPFDHSTVTIDTAQSNLSTLASYAKNFLPLLFNLVTRIEHKRDVVLECVEAYASISDSTTINALFKRVLQRLLEADTASMSGVVDVSVTDRAHVMSDIVLAMTASLDESNVGLLWRSVEAQLTGSDAITQKKAYKLLSGICRHHPQYFAQHWQQILAAVTAATSSLLPSAAKVRLTCLTALCLPIPPLLITAGDEGRQLLSHLPQLLGEVLLALKEPSFKTRSAAYGFINQLGQAMTAADTQLVSQDLVSTLDTWQLSSPDPLHPLFNEYLYMLLGGLAGTSPHMQSATVMAFSHLLFSCRAAMPPAMTASLLSTFLPLLGSPSREVNKSMMGLVKVIALSLPPDQLRYNLDDLFGRYFVSLRLQPEKADMARNLITWIRQAFERNLPVISWMDDKTRAVAMEKANAVLELVGGPTDGAWADYSRVTITRDQFYINWLQIQQMRADDEWRQLTRPISRAKFTMNPSLVNAQYSPRANAMTYPAAILQEVSACTARALPLTALTAVELHILYRTWLTCPRFPLCVSIAVSAFL